MTDQGMIRISEDDWESPSEPGRLDEFVARGVNIHFEAMGESQFWMQIDDPVAKKSWHVNCGAVNTRAKGYAFIEEDV